MEVGTGRKEENIDFFSFFTSSVHAKSLQSCPNLCNPMDCSLPGSSVPGDSPGKNTGGGCLSSSRRSSRPRDRTHISYISMLAAGSLALAPPGKVLDKMLVK